MINKILAIILLISVVFVALGKYSVYILMGAFIIIGIRLIIEFYWLGKDEGWW